MGHETSQVESRVPSQSPGEPWAEPRAEPKPSSELSPAHWADSESQAESEPRAEMSRGPNSESSWAALSRSLSCDKPSLELSVLSKPRRASSQAEPSPKLRATKCWPVVWCSANRAGVMWNGQRWGSVTVKLEFGKSICLEARSWW